MAENMTGSYAERVQMALAEAGYPAASVFEDSDDEVFVIGVPEDVVLHAFTVCDDPHSDPRS